MYLQLPREYVLDKFIIVLRPCLFSLPYYHTYRYYPSMCVGVCMCVSLSPLRHLIVTTLRNVRHCRSTGLYTVNTYTL